MTTNFFLKILLLLLMLSLIRNNYAKGTEGYYTLSVTMINKETKEAITNTMFHINGEPIKTDTNGRLTCQIKWINVCGFSLRFWEKIKANRIKNSKWIVFKLNNSEKKIKNKWKKYGKKQHWKRNPKEYYTKIYWQ